MGGSWGHLVTLSAYHLLCRRLPVADQGVWLVWRSLGPDVRLAQERIVLPLRLVLVSAVPRVHQGALGHERHAAIGLGLRQHVQAGWIFAIANFVDFHLLGQRRTID